ncbi:MAG TPA: molybdopterin molybdotransferase MoeA, partial [Terriglobales bacterium]|nr:molybdopterin molybdotransferase MoeA [Terriglobales bacterium]
PVEDTDASGETGSKLPTSVVVRVARKQGDFVRPSGEDYRAGDVLLNAGTRLRAQDIGLLAQLGMPKVRVYRKPRVAIFSSGEELLPIDAELKQGKIFESNSYVLAPLVQGAGGDVIVLGIAKDNLEDVKAHLDRAVSEKADLILSSAGVSVGAFDFLRDAVNSNGSLDFWKVNMRPGRPFTFGNYRNTAYIGLPGNPASAFVGFEIFVRPGLEKMAGANNWERHSIKALLTEDVESDGRESFLRVGIEQKEETPNIYLTGHQGSGNLYSLVQAQGLLHVPAGKTKLTRGSLQKVLLL